MNELNSRLLEYLPDPNTVKGGISGVVEGIQTEAPQLVNEILVWHFTISLYRFSIGLLVMIGLSLLLRLKGQPAFVEWENKCERKDKGFPTVVYCALWVCLSLPSLIILCTNLTWLRIWVAPRLFLLEYINSFL